jgi:hypothetical protein
MIVVEILIRVRFVLSASRFGEWLPPEPVYFSEVM